MIPSPINLVDGALVAVDRLHHPLEHGIEELARLLGIAVGEQLHGALEVGEEHGHLLALALEGGLGGQNLLREVLGGVRLGAGEAARGLGGERGAAGPQNFLPGVTGVPQLGQAASSRAPQSSRKRAPASFSA